MTTDEELKSILEELKASGELEDNSNIEDTLKEGWNTAIVVGENGIKIFYLSNGEFMVSEIGIQTSVEEIIKRIENSSYGLPHQIREDYMVVGNNTIYLRYGIDGINRIIPKY